MGPAFRVEPDYLPTEQFSLELLQQRLHLGQVIPLLRLQELYKSAVHVFVQLYGIDVIFDKKVGVVNEEGKLEALPLLWSGRARRLCFG